MFEAEKVTKASSGFGMGFRRAVVVSSLVSVAVLANAATATYSSPVFAAVDTSSATFLLPQFDPALGHLLSVTVSLSDSTFTASEVVNLNTVTTDAGRWSKSVISDTVSSGAFSSNDTVTALSFDGATATESLPTFAGHKFVGGTPITAGNSSLGSDTEGATPATTYTDNATLTDFTGFGNVTVTDGFGASGWTAANGSHSGFIVNFGSAEATITYNYQPVPAPAAAGTMLIGLVGAISRRRKS